VRIKTFQGRSLEDVLPQIREELGPSAVVLGQRTKVQGGVAGFFGTKVVEVTAADRMPDDQQLVELEDRIMSGVGADTADAGSPGDEFATMPSGRDVDPEEAALADRFAGAMRMGRQGGLDLVDDWDPAQDAELAQEYGKVLGHAASAGFSELDVPVVEPATAPVSDPLAQARALTERAHDHMRAATYRVEESYGLPPEPAAPAMPSQTYAPPAALPRTTPVQERARTFAASVIDAPGGGAPAHIGHGQRHAANAGHVEDSLREDLGYAPTGPGPATGDQINDAISAAVDMIDLKAMAALRNAMHVTRRLEQDRTTAIDPSIELAVGRISQRLSHSGVDDDVVQALLDTALKHRRPFGGEQGIEQLMRSIVEETIEVRSGFPTLGRPYRIALVGGSSSGKSTVAAKIAQAYTAIGLRVGLVSILAADPSSAVAGDARFQHLDIDVRYAATPEQAAQSAETFERHDLVLVDTPGTTYLDRGTYAQVAACLAALGVDDVHVVVPLATSSREARSLVDAFRPLGANRLIVSRLDESRHIGQLLNFGFRLGVPMTFLSDGPRIPRDLRAASAREIADLILPPAETREDAFAIEENTAR